MTLIDANINIEDMVHKYPGTVKWLIAHGLPCVVCGEPFWGTLKELCQQKGWDDEKIQALVDEFNVEHKSPLS